MAVAGTSTRRSTASGGKKTKKSTLKGKGTKKSNATKRTPGKKSSVKKVNRKTTKNTKKAVKLVVTPAPAAPAQAAATGPQEKKDRNPPRFSRYTQQARAIRKLQKQRGLLYAKAPFYRMIREMVERQRAAWTKENPGVEVPMFRFKKQALDNIMFAAEQFQTKRFQQAYNCMLGCGKTHGMVDQPYFITSEINCQGYSNFGAQSVAV